MQASFSRPRPLGTRPILTHAHEKTRQVNTEADMNSKSIIPGRHEAVSILYCHGWGSNFDPSKKKIRALAKALPVDGITVDYTSHQSRLWPLATSTRDENCEASASITRWGTRRAISGASVS